MKYPIVLALALGLAACGRSSEEHAGPVAPTPAPPPPSVDAHSITGPFTHDNLAIYLLQREDAPEGDENLLTLEEALESGVVKVAEQSEGAQVNTLELENIGDQPVYIQAGDTVKGGKQDRSIAVDFKLPPKSGKMKLDAFCVEPGRWSARERSLVTTFSFSESPAPVATKEQKLAIKLQRDQSKVWEAGRYSNLNLFHNSFSSGQVQDSYVLAVEDPAVKKKIQEYVAALQKCPEGKKGVVGMAFAINGEINTIEIYASTSLFRKLWPKLLRSSALEALAKKAEKSSSQGITSEEIQDLLSKAGRKEGTSRELPLGTKISTVDGKDAVLFDTEEGGTLYHRQIIKK